MKLSAACLTCDQLKDKAYIRQMHNKLNAVFDHHSCVDCGETDRTVFEFTTGPEVWNLIAQQMPWPTISKAINKAEVICANCARKRVAERVGMWGIPSPT